MRALVVVEHAQRRRLRRPDLQHAPEHQRVVESGGHLAGEPAYRGPRALGQLLLHERPAVASAPGLDIPRVLQRLDRLPQRDAADVEPAGEVALGGQPLSRLDHPELDRLQQPLDRLLERVTGPDGAEQGLVDPGGERLGPHNGVT